MIFDKAIFKALVFLLPTQLALHFWPNWAHIFGIRVDYLSPAIYLTDLLIGLLFIFWVKSRPKILKSVAKWGIGLLLFAFLNIYFSQSLFPSIFRWIKVFEFIFLGFYIATKREFQIKEWVIQPLILSVIFFSLIGIAQFLFQRTLGGVFYYLGERSFTSNTPGIALVELFGRNYLRVYSTFSHPNSLGGYFAVSLLLISGFTKKSKVKNMAILFSCLAVILSFSLGAYLGLLLVGIIYLFQKRISKRELYLIIGGILLLSLSLPYLSRVFLMERFINNLTLMRRLALAEISQKIIFQNPILGVGLNNFIIKLSQQSLYPQVSWWLQPVHNIYLLVLSETGLVGLFLFLFMIISAVNHSLMIFNRKLIIPILFILITGVADHYWLTLQQNLLLFTLVFGLSFRRWKNN